MNKLDEILNPLYKGNDISADLMSLLIMDELCHAYDIREPKDITDEILQHYFGIGDKEETQLNRSIFFVDDAEREEDYVNPINADKLNLLQKGIHIDNCCKILGIEKTGDYEGFHLQIKGQEIYEEDVIGSDWYKQIALHRDLVPALFMGLAVPKDFKDNPLPFLGQFCLKVFGITYKLNQETWKEARTDIINKVTRQHTLDGIYRDWYGGTPRATREKRNLSLDWIKNKRKTGGSLTALEKQLHRTLCKHIKISNSQPRYTGYLSNKLAPQLSIHTISRDRKNSTNDGESR